MVEYLDIDLNVNHHAAICGRTEVRSTDVDKRRDGMPAMLDGKVALVTGASRGLGTAMRNVSLLREQPLPLSPGRSSPTRSMAVRCVRPRMRSWLATEDTEEIELIVEAALILYSSDPSTMTGRVVRTQPFLKELGHLQ